MVKANEHHEKGEGKPRSPFGQAHPVIEKWKGLDPARVGKPGGRSQRMGREKALIEIGKKPLIEIASGRVAGYVGLDILDARHVAVSWVAKSASGNNAVMVRSVALDGTLGPPIKAGNTRQLRVFPQLAVSGDSLVAVWTDEPDGQRVMKVAIAPWLGS